MKYRLIAATCAALALMACSQSAAPPQTKDDGRVVRVATEGAYPPFNDLTADGNLVGFDVDVMNAVCEQMQVTCQITDQDWDGILPGLLVNKYDAVIAGMSITDERLAQVDFSEPYFANTLVWLSKKDGDFDPNDVHNKTLGGQRSTTGAIYLNDAYGGKQGNRVQLYDSYIKAYLDLAAGRVDAVLAEKVSALEWLQDGKNADFHLVGDEIDNNDRIAIAVRKNDPLKDEFNRALQELKASGKLAQIEAKHFAASVAESVDSADSAASGAPPSDPS